MAEPWSAPPCAKANAEPLPSKTRTMAMSQLYALYRFKTWVGASTRRERQAANAARHASPAAALTLASSFFSRACAAASVAANGA